MNKKDIFIGALVAIIVLLIALLILIICDVIKVGEPKIITEYKQCEENTNETISYTYDQIEGLYGTSSNDLTYIIYLYKNGTFVYIMDNGIVPNINFGNYLINDNKIILNYLINVNTRDINESYVGIEKQEITTNEEKSLTLNSKPEKLEDISTTLKEITGDKKQNLIDTNLFNIEYLLETLLKNTEEAN